MGKVQRFGGASDFKSIAGIKILDTGIVGTIVISATVVYIHNRLFAAKLPDFLGIFQVSSFVMIISFFIMLPVDPITLIKLIIMQRV